MLPGDTPDHQLGNTTDVSAFLADSINQLRRGQLDPRVANAMGYLTSVLLRSYVANAMGYLTSVLLRSLEQGPLEERLARLEVTLGLSIGSQNNNPPKETGPHGDTKPTEAN